MTKVDRFYTTGALGEKRKTTPEGFLVCYDVPMARTGEMLYGPDETPVPSVDGVSGVRIARDADEVFAPDTVLSIIGKPVTNDHPDENVTPENWVQHAVGSVISARQGEGAHADLLLGDIMITDKRAIQDILSGKREVSAGYDADYEELSPGVGRQKNIYYNHLALVDKGRCGPRCAIGDYLPPELQQENENMAKGTKRVIVNDRKTLIARLKGLVGGKVSDADIEKAVEEETSDEVTTTEEGTTPGMGAIHITLNGAPKGETTISADDLPGEGGTPGEEANEKTMDPAIEARFQGIESGMQQIVAAIQKIMPQEEEAAAAEELAEEAPSNLDAKTVSSAKDSAFMQDSWATTLQTAEIIVPGVRMPPTFDRAAAPKKTLDALCAFRRTVLDLAYGRPDTRGLMDELNGGKTVDTKCMTCDKIRNMFRSVGVARASTNNQTARDTRLAVLPAGAVASPSPIRTIADLNKHLADKRAARKSA